MTVDIDGEITRSPAPRMMRWFTLLTVALLVVVLLTNMLGLNMSAAEIQKKIADEVRVGDPLQSTISRLQADGFACSDITASLDPDPNRIGYVYACSKLVRERGKLFPVSVLIKITTDSLAERIETVSVRSFNNSL